MNEDIFREILLEHARHPKRVGELSDAHGKGSCHNPLCGDKIAVSLIMEDDIVKSLRILPSGCSISTASASLMTELVEGKSIAHVMSHISNINEIFSPKNTTLAWPASLEILSPLKRIRENPLKIPCVLISWIALQNAFNNYKQST